MSRRGARMCLAALVVFALLMQFFGFNQSLSNNDAEVFDVRVAVLQQQLLAIDQSLADFNKQLSDWRHERIAAVSRVINRVPSPAPRPSPPVRYDGCDERRVQAFYYPWYGTPNIDGEWYHWNHKYLPHWTATVNSRYKDLIGVRHRPELGDVGANFYPQLGPYSSANRTVMNIHMAQMAQAGIGTAISSWFPAGEHEDNGLPLDPLTSGLLDAAQQHNMHLALHLEPYSSRTAKTVARDLEYISKTYGSHPALYRMCRPSDRAVPCKKLPVVYVYDSYHIRSTDWAQVLQKGQASIRDTNADAVVLGLWVEAGHGQELQRSGFDGFYSYFASPISHGAKVENWPQMNSFAQKNKMIFVPCVGPGYMDVSVRPWNGDATRDRAGGKYYRRMFEAATKLTPQTNAIAITSFNEWHEGTQIEPAAAAQRKEGGKYLEYDRPDMYLTLTASLLHEAHYCDANKGSN
eukprot:c16569_g1_i2.p1 GENE.c16569_g1_i2~~c16569_g1_i2.p1  ORF type:complete len:463 (+),score=74.66 c16569_g1_i2:33-1421(+)